MSQTAEEREARLREYRPETSEGEAMHFHCFPLAKREHASICLVQFSGLHVNIELINNSATDIDKRILKTLLKEDSSG